MKLDFRTQVAEEMIRHIEAGTAPWQKPWTPGKARIAPHNPSSGTVYRGINAWWLSLQGLNDPRWMTFRQAKAMDAQVRKGEKGTQVEYWQWSEKRQAVDGDGNPILGPDGKPALVEFKLDRPRTFYAHVFNASQIDGLEPFVAPPPGFDPVEKAEQVLAQGEVKIAHDQGDRAFYRPIQDSIHLPDKAAFSEAYQYYATALHELGHATGHKSRLIRDMSGPFGSEKYAEEELRAEMASFMVATELGLGHYPERHAGYVESWLKALKNDRNVIFRAAADAEHVRTWIMEPDKRVELHRAAENREKARETAKQQEGQSMDQPEQEKKMRVFLDVPFAEKDEAKAKGAKWDRREKSWYVPDNVDAAVLAQLTAKWTAKGEGPARAAENPVEEFKAALMDHGLKVTGAPLMDGQWHRVPVEGDQGKERSGSYRGYLDGTPNGQITNYKLGHEAVKWVATGARMDPAERDRLQKQSAERAKNQDQARKTMHRDTARKAFGVWSNAAPAPADHPYLARKGVEAHDLKQDKDGNLLVPLRDDRGFLWNLQTVTPDGEKRFLTGGKKSGLHHLIDPDQALGRALPTTVIVAEGYATAASLHQATGLPTAVAFDAGNLDAVTKRIKEKNPNADVVIAADNDHKRDRNVGVEKADEAARKNGVAMMTPAFGDAEKAAGATDYNDLHRLRPETFNKQVWSDLKEALATHAQAQGRDRAQAQEQAKVQAKEQAPAKDAPAKPTRGRGKSASHAAGREPAGMGM